MWVFDHLPKFKDYKGRVGLVRLPLNLQQCEGWKRGPSRETELAIQCHLKNKLSHLRQEITWFCAPRPFILPWQAESPSGTISNHKETRLPQVHSTNHFYPWLKLRLQTVQPRQLRLWRFPSCDSLDPFYQTLFSTMFCCCWNNANPSAEWAANNYSSSFGASDLFTLWHQVPYWELTSLKSPKLLLGRLRDHDSAKSG